MNKPYSSRAKVASKLVAGLAASAATIALSTSSAFALPPTGGEGGGGGGGTGGGTSAPKFEVVVESLLCRVTEDNSGPDEPYLLGNNVRFWGNGSLNNEQSANIDRSFNGQGTATIKLYDADLGSWPDRDDYLGTVIVTSDQINQGTITGTFRGDGASYEVMYHVNSR